MSTTVTYKNQIVTTVTNTTKELTTRGKYLEDNIHLTDVSGGGGNLQEKTGVEPSTVSQTLTPDPGYDGFSSVQINAMPTGSEGTPIATKGAVQDHALAVTPSVVNTAGYIPGGTRTGAPVSVAASELVSGDYTISNAGYHDVTNYERAYVTNATIHNPTGNKIQVNDHTVGVIPRVSYTNGYTSSGSKTGTQVNVTASEVCSGTKEITQNGTGIDVVGYESVNVNVSGGSGWTTDGLADGSEPNGNLIITNTAAISACCFYACSGIRDVIANSVTGINYAAFQGSGITNGSFQSVTQLPDDAFHSATNLQTIDIRNCIRFSTKRAFHTCSALTTFVGGLYKLQTFSDQSFYNCSSLTSLVLPAITSNFPLQAAAGCTSLTAVDLGSGMASFSGQNSLNGCTSLQTIILRRSSAVVTLGNVNVFTNTKFNITDGVGGDIYIPQALYNALGTGVNDYKATSNWSALDAAGRITWHALEGSYYETHYADGTLIPTT